MVLTAGARLGAYEIIGPLGAGGMGEVYRARDTKLNRDVAIKVLLSAVANDADRLGRFSREAQMLAALNHPNIAHIHGVEDADGVRALVMELVEGPTLADRIAHGPIPVDEALPMAKQIAEALEVAHAQGIIHRDLKPANIKVRPDGTIKVLDFGLAKVLDPATGTSADAAISPTISLHATQAGVILGTAAYMSPEQARGKVVDARADIWAFGCVLFEMLTGRRPFSGDDVTDTIVAVVSKEPDWDALPPAASALRPLLTRCLRKIPKQRLQAIGDARIQIEELISGTSAETVNTDTPTRASYRHVAPAAVAALTLGAVIGALVAWTIRGSAPGSAVPSRFELAVPPAEVLGTETLDRDVIISPDGQNIAYRGGAAGALQLFLRPIGRLDSQPLRSLHRTGPIFFSPDGRWIGFFDASSLRKISITGGSPITICETLAQPRGASWGDDDSIVFTTTDVTTGLLRVPSRGGEPTVLTRPDSAKGESNHWHPSVLPGGRGVLFSIAAPSQGDRAQIAVLDFNTGQQKTLIHGGSQAEYVHTGHLVYAAAGTLRAVRFDLDRLEIVGDPIPIVEDVWMAPNGAARYSISRSGTLVYAPAGGGRLPRALVWVDRQGNETPIRAPHRLYTEPRIAPDSTRVVLAARDDETDLWLWHFQRETLTRLTFGPGLEQNPAWAHDSRRIVFASQRGNVFSVFVQTADGTGTAQELTSSRNSRSPAYVAPDGSGMVIAEVDPKTRGDIVWLPMGIPASRPGASSASPVEPLVRTPFVEYNPEIAPNTRYMAYQSEESGRTEIYVRPFPQVNEGRWQVSTAGGTRPLWSRDGRELFYLDMANTLMAVPVQTGPTFASGNPIKVFDTQYAPPLTGFRTYDASADGKRFLMIKQTTAVSEPRTGIVVVLNWFEELKAKLPPVSR